MKYEVKYRENLEGKLESIGTALAAKFGAPGLELIPRVSPVTREEELDDILRQVILTNSLEKIRQFILNLSAE